MPLRHWPKRQIVATRAARVHPATPPLAQRRHGLERYGFQLAGKKAAPLRSGLS